MDSLNNLILKYLLIKLEYTIQNNYGKCFYSIKLRVLLTKHNIQCSHSIFIINNVLFIHILFLPPKCFH